jgi:hypothetical protein
MALGSELKDLIKWGMNSLGTWYLSMSLNGTYTRSHDMAIFYVSPNKLPRDCQSNFSD